MTVSPSLWETLKSRVRRHVPDELHFLFRMPAPIIDYNGDYTKSVFLAGAGRSGTTWVSNVINYDNTYRDMFEPFHAHYVHQSRKFVHPLYLRPENRLEEYLRPARRILTGQIWHPWIDRFNRRTIVSWRLIKEVRANLWLKWLRANFPGVPIILLLRHPCAVVESRLALEWPTRLQQHLAQPDLMEDHLEPLRGLMLAAHTPFEKHVIVWSLQHLVPFRQFRAGEIHVAFFENFLAKPEEEVHRLFAFLKRPYDGRVFDALRRKSKTTFMRGTERADPDLDLIGSWRGHLDRSDLKRALDILARFGLDRIYGEEPLPNERGVAELWGATIPSPANRPCGLVSNAAGYGQPPHER